MAPKSRVKGEYEGEANEKGLDISGLHQTWDGDQAIRHRLRNGLAIIHEKSGLAADNNVCKLNRPVLEPILLGMAGTPDRKLPCLADLRNEMQVCFRSNGRTGQAVQDCVVSDAIHIRKLLSHVKTKTRRHEVSLEARPLYLINPLKVCSFQPLCSPSQDPDFQELCLALDPGLQDTSLSILIVDYLCGSSVKCYINRSRKLWIRSAAGAGLWNLWRT